MCRVFYSYFYNEQTGERSLEFPEVKPDYPNEVVTDLDHRSYEGCRLRLYPLSDNITTRYSSEVPVFLPTGRTPSRDKAKHKVLLRKRYVDCIQNICRG